MRRIVPVIAACLLVACSPKPQYAHLADPFWGSGPTQAFSDGMARGWNWEKAQSGNTSPAAVLPYGWMSVCVFSGGYSSGYGLVRYSSCFEPQLMDIPPKAYGVTHLHQSGVGLMGRFYNYFLITPYVAGSDISVPSEMSLEHAVPGYYTTSLPDYGAWFELSVQPYAAIHRWSFEGDGCLRLDVSHLGLGTECFQPIRPHEKPEKVESCSIRALSPSCWAGTVRTYGVDIHYAFCVDVKKPLSTVTDSTLTLCLKSDKAVSSLGLSLVSEQEAVARARKALADGFDRSVKQAEKAWDDMLGRIRVTFGELGDPFLFYSTLYHSMTKPCECAPGRLVDFATFWDAYHTALPLMLSASPSKARLLAGHLLRTVDSLGFSPISQVLDATYRDKDNQCTAIPVYTICDAFHRGVITDYPKLKAALEKEYAHADLAGMPPSHTLDLAGAYAAGAFVADCAADKAFADSLRNLSCIWKTVYDVNSGLLIKDAPYYEGNYLNYSFRPHVGMNERVEMAGGPERFCELLDTFFCVGDDCPDWDPTQDRIRRRDHFEGLNNETDMDSPYAYLWCGRPDRLAEVIDAVRYSRFNCGDGGCPGNNDSGALSSWYVWNCLGLYPLAGTPYYLLGSPSVESAQFDFAGGTLEIEVERESPGSIYPLNYSFNGVEFNEPWIKVSELEKGGRLVFRLADKPSTAKAPVPTWL